MKIRTDFVTNSSSSSYCVEVSVVSKEGVAVSLCVDPTDQYIGGGGEAHIEIDEQKIRSAKTVKELYDRIVDSIEFTDADMVLEDLIDEFDEIEELPDPLSVSAVTKLIKKIKKSEDYDEDLFEEYCLDYFDSVQKDAAKFQRELKKKVQDVEQIEKIVIEQKHYSWGEFFDLLSYISYPHDAEPEVLREHLEKSLTPDSCIGDIMACIEGTSSCNSLNGSEKTIIDFVTGKTEDSITVYLD